MTSPLCPGRWQSYDILALVQVRNWRLPVTLLTPDASEGGAREAEGRREGV